MTKIRVMPEALASKIAAGEVVERPASVVKELVENAIDAGADRITVEVRGSHCRSIRVVDNGCGMEEDDVLLALERHATSKITSEKDLAAISSLGFRGEALPSLAAVSRFELSSRTRQATAGTRVRLVGGSIREVCHWGCPAGTQVLVRDLFYNQPARRKFLRSERAEFGQLAETFTRLGLTRAEIHFSLYHRDRLVYDWPAAANLEQRLAQVFPGAGVHSWLPLSYNQELLGLKGYLGPPEIQRANSRMLFFHVNGRPVRDRLLTLALLEAYRSLLPKGRYSVGVVFVELPPEQVDVNVHPSKAEVRFRHPRAVCQALTTGARNSLAAMERRRWQRPLAARAGRLAMVAPSLEQTVLPQERVYRLGEARPPAYGSAAGAGLEWSQAEPGLQRPAAAFGSLAVIGQLHCSYVVCEAPDGLVVIDQHAAHERILFEALRRESTAGPLASQALLVPETIEVSAREAAWLEKSLPLLARLGFGLSPFGHHTFAVQTVPAQALRQEPLALLAELLAVGCAGSREPAAEDVLERLLQSLACRLAVKAGQRLGPEEIEELLEGLEKLDYSSTCPHGRPLWWKLSLGELEKIFHRT